METTWANQAYKYLEDYVDIQDHDREFLAEDIRYSSEGHVPLPSNPRAWGSVVRKAKRDGVIVATGYAEVTNKKAHATPATLWAKAPKKPGDEEAYRRGYADGVQQMIDHVNNFGE